MKRPLSILMVEDEVLTAMCLTKELEAFGYTVLKNVTSGEEAIKNAKEKNPDLILMDIRLAGKLDGIETLREIQKSNAIPVIIMTGNSDSESKNRAAQLNFLAYFVKPISAKEIKEVIDSTLYRDVTISD
jgi:CheY-like chemotaxis protein